MLLLETYLDNHINSIRELKIRLIVMKRYVMILLHYGFSNLSS